LLSPATFDARKVPAICFCGLKLPGKSTLSTKAEQLKWLGAGVFRVEKRGNNTVSAQVLLKFDDGSLF